MTQTRDLEAVDRDGIWAGTAEYAVGSATGPAEETAETGNEERGEEDTEDEDIAQQQWIREEERERNAVSANASIAGSIDLRSRALLCEWRREREWQGGGGGRKES